MKTVRKKLGGVKGVVSASSRNPRSPLAGHRTPPELPPRARLQAEAKTLLPPGAYMWMGRQSGTWQSHLPPRHRRFSQSWSAAGGHDEACLGAIRDAWHKFLGDNHMKISQCPIKGLFPDGGILELSAQTGAVDGTRANMQPHP